MVQDVFAQCYKAGVFRSVSVLIRDDLATVRYVTSEGSSGYIFTKRGDLKHYRLDTVLRFLREIGMDSVQVDMHEWNRSQG